MQCVDASADSSGGATLCDVPTTGRLFFYVKRENTYSSTVVSRIRFRLKESTLLSVRFDAERLDTSLLGPSLYACCAGKLVPPGNVYSATHSGKDAHDDHNNTRYRHSC